MAAITWTDSLSVKIQSIDEQHKKLIELINTFYENITEHPNSRLISDLLAGMKTYAIIHFNTEEMYMEQFEYPGYGQHKKEHSFFIQKVNELEVKFNDGATILSYEITSFLKNWIKKHIKDSDKQYSEFFIKRGVE